MLTRQKWQQALLWTLALGALGSNVGSHVRAQGQPQATAPRQITTADRIAAAARAAAKSTSAVTTTTTSAPTATANAPTPGGAPNYFGPESNWAFSPTLQKFVDTLPGLGPAAANNLGQYIPIAVPDTTTYAGSDYYEIELGEYTEKLHSDLAPTTLRGYRQTNTTDATVSRFSYLGPMIFATRDRPVRVKFTNKLPTGAGGQLFLPVDTTVDGAGLGSAQGSYTQNRATLHLRGGHTVWISDGTEHQWITPAGEQTDYPEGVSVQNVPDMGSTDGSRLCGAKDDGCETFYYSNRQSARLMFFGDNTFGITRLNVYAGEAGPYLLTDAVEQDLIARGIVPDRGIPLIIQDKTFVNSKTILANDPTWPFALNADTSNLWLPHVYMPNQNPNDPLGINARGRWDYGPSLGVTGPTVSPLPNLSETPDAYMDTPLVNGTAYPVFSVQPRTYRFRILNAANDRFWNLQLHQAASGIVSGIGLTALGSGAYKDPPLVTITPAPGDTGRGATASTTIDANGQVTAITVNTVGSGYRTPPTVIVAPPPAGTAPLVTAAIYTAPTEVGMVPFDSTLAFPAGWPTRDARAGGVPDPALIGPSMIQIGSDGGFLPTPVVVPNIPLGHDNVGNVREHALLLGPGERADVIVDFSPFAGKTLILYSDACAPCPVAKADARVDYYTGDLDLTSIGGASSTPPGYGPNTRTIMAFQVADVAPAAAFKLETLQAEFASTATAAGVFARSQDPIIVPQAPYNSAYNGSFSSPYARLQDSTLTFTTLGSLGSTTVDLRAKAIAEEFESAYGRMAAFLGVAFPATSFSSPTTVSYSIQDPPTEIVNHPETQLWKIRHAGAETQAIHFHLFDVQLVNRVGHDGTIRPPDANELGWKDTVRMNPLEDVIVAMRPTAPAVPFFVADSVRLLDPTRLAGSTGQFRNVNPVTSEAVTVTNVVTNFGWEYEWHSQMMGHGDMAMMRPVVLGVPRPNAPSGLTATVLSGPQVRLDWTDNADNETGYVIMRSVNGGPPTQIAARGSAQGTGSAMTYSDSSVILGTTYGYEVYALIDSFPSAPSNPVTVTVVAPPAAPTALAAQLQSGPKVRLTWTDNAANETGFVVERSTNGAAFGQIAAPGPHSGTGNVAYTDTGVAPGSSYDYRVKAMNGAAASAYSNVPTVVVPRPPAAPSSVTVTAVRAGKADTVVLAWSDVAGETGYEIQRAADRGFSTGVSNFSVGVNLAQLAQSVARGMTYYYRVRAVNLGGPSAWVNATPFPIVTP